MSIVKILLGLITLSVVVLLAGCGSSGPSTESSTGITGGIAVDPYIENAVFQELAADGVTVLQRESSPSDAQGRFSFVEPLSEGSIIELKISRRGLHEGAPFEGMLRRRVVSSGETTLVVSPLTTLLANGFDESEVVDALAAAGLQLSVDDLYRDPMPALADQSGRFSDEQLKPLHANMAVNHLMTTLDRFDINRADLDDHNNARLLAELVKANQALLNEAEFLRLKSELGSRIDGNTPLLPSDLLTSVVRTMRTVVAQAKAQQASGTLVATNIGRQVNTFMSDSIQGALALYLERVGPGMPPVADPEPLPVADGQALYDAQCAGCHKLGGFDSAGSAPELAGKDAFVAGKINAGHRGIVMTTAELTALVDWVALNPAVTEPAPTPAPNPAPNPAPDGIALYESECQGCHGPLSTSNIQIRTHTGIQQAIDTNLGGMGMLTLTLEEVQAIADSLPSSTPTPIPDPTPVDGQTLYDNSCASCHKLGDYDTVGFAPELGGQGNLVISKIEAGHQSLSLTADELNALADWADANPAPVVIIPDPTPVPVDGQALYDNNCAGCHAVNGYDASGAPDLAGAGDLIAGKLAAGHKGFVLSADEELALADFLDQYQAVVSGPDYSDCTLCHAQPPNGDFFPNTAGAHAVHTALAGIDCSSCHAGAAHNDVVEVALAGTFDAKSGTATDNGDGTCSAVSCHGGQTTPDWFSGTLAVETQCASCHSRSTTEFNGYTSGEHGKHRSYDCTVCHNTAKLETGHFSNLATSGFETSPATTIGGGSTRVGSYANGSCSSIQCHGSEQW